LEVAEKIKKKWVGSMVDFNKTPKESPASLDMDMELTKFHKGPYSSFVMDTATDNFYR
jgi:hypothetical protein